MRTRTIVSLVAVFVALAGTAAVWRAVNPAPAHAGALHAMEVRKAEGAYAPPASDRVPLTILAIGSDYRPGETPCSCADSIHLITVNPQKRAATILGFPRDSWVDIPGHGQNRINTALKTGGAPLLVDTVERLTGIGIDYYLLTDFEGFSRAVDGIGGLDVDVPYAMHDSYSGADFEPGRVHMKGGHALAFARNRHGTPGGDIGRSHNHGRVLLAAVRKIAKDFAHDPASVVSWVAVGSRYLQTDLGLGELTRLALAATQVKESAVDNLVVPSTIGEVGSASVVFITDAARGIYVDIKSDGILDR